jgi:hypothetical protein
VRFWQRLFGGSARAAFVMMLALGCGHSQRPAAISDISQPQEKTFDSPECRAAEADARILRVVGEMAPKDVEAIKGVVAAISNDPVVMIRTPPGFEKVLAKYGPGVVEVKALASWSCESSSGELLFVVRESGTWRVINESYKWDVIVD